MRKKQIVRAPRLRDYFRYERKFSSFRQNIWFNAPFFNGVSFLTTLGLLSACYGLSNFKFMAIPISVFSLMLFLYFKAQLLAQSLKIERKVQSKAREHSALEVSYTISNVSAFSLQNIKFIELFDGIQDASFSVILPTVRPRSRLVVKKILQLNAGMGVKTFKAITLQISDVLNLFTFEIEFPETRELEVYPLIQELTPLKSSVSPDSIQYGKYELSRRGDNNLFMGIRDYRHGDPVRFINWKLTKKARKLVINEFERNTNTSISLVLDLELNHQLGKGAVSTWETAKDLSLAIAAHETTQSNFIQVLANNLHIPFATGPAQLATIERHFTFHQLETTSKEYLRRLEELPARSQVFFICPKLMTPELRNSLHYFGNLKLAGHEVIIFILNPYQELSRLVGPDQKITMLALDRLADQEFSTFTDDQPHLKRSMFEISVKEVFNLDEEVKNSMRARGLDHFEGSI